MTDNVSVRSAVQRARLILAPAVILPLPLFLLILNIVTRCNVPDYVVMIAFISGMVLIIAAVLVYWKKTMAKWQAWAFTNVDNVHELKRAAEIANLINGFIGIDDLSRKYPEVYKQIKQRLDGPCKYTDDQTVPAETVIYNRKLYQRGLFFFGFVYLMIGAYMLYRKFDVPGILFTLVPAGIILWQYSKTTDRTPQLVLNDEGIEARGEFTRWDAVINDEIVRSGSRYITFTLTYEYPDGKKEIGVNDLYIKPTALNHLLFVYRGRYRAKYGTG